MQQDTLASAWRVILENIAEGVRGVTTFCMYRKTSLRNGNHNIPANEAHRTYTYACITSHTLINTRIVMIILNTG